MVDNSGTFGGALRLSSRYEEATVQCSAAMDMNC